MTIKVSSYFDFADAELFGHALRFIRVNSLFHDRRANIVVSRVRGREMSMVQDRDARLGSCGL